MRQVFTYLVPLLLLSCSGGTGENSSESDSLTASIINPPLKGDFQNDTVFVIDPTIENRVETPNGSSVVIPANTLVDADGNVIAEPSEISFVQYHSAVDILASGIPMTYDSAGASHNFESAGMFSLHGESQDKPVFIKSGAAINVNLASDKDEAFNFYQMNEQSGHWTYEHAPQPVLSNQRYDPSVKPIEPKKATNGAFVLDLNFDLSSYSELSVFSGIVWEYTGEHDSLDPRNNKEVASTKWTDFELTPTYEKAYEYLLTMKNKTKSFTTKVMAALNGDDFDQAMSTFQTKKVEIAQKMDRLQKPYIRSVSIGNFGTYNYDYIHSMQDPQPMVADFDFGTRNNDKEHALVFVMYPETGVVVNYPQDQWKLFALDKKQDGKVLAILPDNQLAVCKNDLAQSYGKQKYTFKMTVLPEKVTSKQDLERIIAEL
ncbi:MAG: hypothetical protein HYZ14_14215 [Bacteroidetes bacterium]|nr:hypothetical protein [Bacteroidota bacterium]